MHIPGPFLKFWQRLPFRTTLLVVIGLYLIKERYPFSNFPMYSKVDEEADILYVTDQADRSLAMKKVFDLGSGSAKKIYKKELATLTAAPVTRIDKIAKSARLAAGQAVMATVIARIQPKDLPAGVTGLRLYRQTFRLANSGLTHLAPELLAEQALPTP